MAPKTLWVFPLSLALLFFTGCKEEDADFAAEFASNVQAIYQGQTVNFSDLSTGDPTAWEWTFQGGSPATSTNQNPSGISYNTPGTYDVTLTITTENGSDTETKEGYITVTQLSGGCGTTTSVTDIDGNTYSVVTIGTQCWMGENLKTSKFRDGSTIPEVSDSVTWSDLTTPASCWYDNDNANGGTYGKLYNWYAIDDDRGICPLGWHVPHDNEFKTLTDFLGAADDIAGGNLKETGTAHWLAPNTGATNSSGFTGLPGGMRFQEGHFAHMGANGLFWSSRRESQSLAFYLNLTYNSAVAHRTYIYKRSGFSCRCVKD